MTVNGTSTYSPALSNLAVRTLSFGIDTPVFEDTPPSQSSRTTKAEESRNLSYPAYVIHNAYGRVGIILCVVVILANDL